MAHNNPYQEGRDAYDKGTRRRDNPYHMAASGHELWDEGWVDRESEELESNDN